MQAEKGKKDLCPKSLVRKELGSRARRHLPNPLPHKGLAVYEVDGESEEAKPDDREACEEKLTQELTIVVVH